MRKRLTSFLYIFICLLIASSLGSSAALAAAAPAPAGDRLAVSGLVTNPMGKGLKEVEVEVLVNGQHVKPTGKDAQIVTGKPGGYVADFILPAGTLPGAKVEVKADKPSWKSVPATVVKVVEAGADATGNRTSPGSPEPHHRTHHHRGLLDRQPYLTENNTIYVDMIEHAQDDPMCCPTQQTVKGYQLMGDQLVELPS